jgi:flagellar protein FlaG
MNTISTIGQTMAMDGQRVYNNVSAQQGSNIIKKTETLPSTAAEVTENLEQNYENTKATAQELQRLSDIVSGNKLKFNVNNELGKVIVSVVDSSTNEVIKQIPSEDLQKIQLRMKQAIGLLFDEII